MVLEEQVGWLSFVALGTVKIFIMHRYLRCELVIWLSGTNTTGGYYPLDRLESFLLDVMLFSADHFP